MSLKLEETQPNPYNYGSGFTGIKKIVDIEVNGTFDYSKRKALEAFNELLKKNKEEYGEHFVVYKQEIEGYDKDKRKYIIKGVLICHIPTKPLYKHTKPDKVVKHGIEER